MADCCDRVIGHYYDPGNLDNAEDIAFFAKMLMDKFQSINPDIDFGISCWVDAYDKNVFVRELGTNVTLYEGGHHDNEGDYNSFRTQVSNYGARLGTWAWNTCEMEIDQLAQMNFNMDIIRSVYQTARKYDAAGIYVTVTIQDCFPQVTVSCGEHARLPAPLNCLYGYIRHIMPGTDRK